MSDLDLTAAIERGLVARRSAYFKGWSTDECVEAAIRDAAPLIAAQVRELIAKEVQGLAAQYAAATAQMHQAVVTGEPLTFRVDDIIRYGAYAAALESAARVIARGGAR